MRRKEGGGRRKEEGEERRNTVWLCLRKYTHVLEQSCILYGGMMVAVNFWESEHGGEVKGRVHLGIKWTYHGEQLAHNFVTLIWENAWAISSMCQSGIEPNVGGEEVKDTLFLLLSLVLCPLRKQCPV